MLRCKQVSRMVARDDLADAGWWLRMKIRLHLLMCRHCERYAAQIRAIGSGARKRFRQREEPTDLEDLQRRILDSAGGTKDEPESS